MTTFKLNPNKPAYSQLKAVFSQGEGPWKTTLPSGPFGEKTRRSVHIAAHTAGLRVTTESLSNADSSVTLVIRKVQSTNSAPATPPVPEKLQIPVSATAQQVVDCVDKKIEEVQRVIAHLQEEIKKHTFLLETLDSVRRPGAF